MDRILGRLVPGARPYLILILLCLALYLPGLQAIPPIDRDESRFAQASHQMLESGDYIRIRFQNELRAKKPAGIYWLQAASASLTGAEDAIWAYRLPSLFGAMAAVLLTFHFGQALFGRPAALLAGALLASAAILVSEAHQAKTDAVLLATIVAAQGVLGRFYLASKGAAPRPGAGLAALFWLAQGVGILIKGPITPLISLLTVLALGLADRRIGWLRNLRPLTGLLLLAAMVGPWLAAVSQATEGQFLGQAVKSDLLPKLLGAQESHGAPPGYFLALFPLTFWPASLYVLPGLVRAWRLRSGASLRFCLAWILPNWLLFEAVPTKLPHYILPTYPALALLAGVAIAAGEAMLEARWFALIGGIWGLLGLAIAAFAVALPFKAGDGLAAASLPVALSVMAGAAGTLLLQHGRRPVEAVGLMSLTAIVVYGGLMGFVLPGLDKVWLSSRIAALLPAGSRVAAAGFHEPSLVFLEGTGTLLTDGAGAAGFLLATEGGSTVIEESQEAAFDKAIAAAGARTRLIGTVEGFNYSRGRPAKLRLWTLEGPPAREGAR